MNTDTKQRLRNIFTRFASPQTLALARREETAVSPARPAAMPPAHYRQEPQIIHMPQQRPLLSQLIRVGAALHPEAKTALYETSCAGYYAYNKRKEYRTGAWGAAYVAVFGLDALAAGPAESQIIWRLGRLVGYDLKPVNQVITELTGAGWDRYGIAEWLEDKGL
ncbi:MAG: hypothetical protein KC421_11885 [Anaerolineales bacterium]|nr:hypothetical protein [Anaerolineales bacterium]